jgi:protein-tyrosine phosphatase
MIQNMQIPLDELTDEDFDFKGTSRKEYEHALYKNLCSEILDGFLYLSGDLVARNEQ